MHYCQFFVSVDLRLTFDVERGNSDMSETVLPSKAAWQFLSKNASLRLWNTIASALSNVNESSKSYVQWKV